MTQFFAGCDTHKKNIWISVIDEKAKEYDSFNIENTETDWNLALNKIVTNYPNCIWGMENSANFTKKFTQMLISNNQKVKEINPSFTGISRKASTKRNKTDKADSILIARVLRDDVNYLPDITFNYQIDNIKTLLREREELVKESTRTKNRLHANLINIDTQYKNWGGIGTKKFYKNIEEKLINTDNACEKVIKIDVKRLQNLQEDIKELEDMLFLAVKDHSGYKVLTSLKGVGLIIASQILSEIKDLKLFKDHNHLASYAGIAPIERSSGQTFKIIRNFRGNRRLNNAFYILALSQIRHNNVSKEYYDKKQKEGKTKKQSIHCLMRKMVKIVFAMLNNNTPYEAPKEKEMVKAV